MSDTEVVVPTLADLAQHRDDLRTLKKDLEDRVKALNAQLDENEGQIMDILDEQGVTRSGVGPFSMSISEQTVGNVTDWDGVYGYISQHKAFHLLQRRLANAAYKELLDLGDAPPGVEPFIKRSLNFRKSSKAA